MPSNLLSNLFPMLSSWLRGPRIEHGPITLNRRRIYILPTRHGLYFTLLLLLLLVGSINYALSLGFVLTFLLAGLGHVALLQTYRNLSGVQISSNMIAPVFAGEQAQFDIRLDAPGPRPAIGLHFKNQPPTWVDLIDPDAKNVAVPLLAQQRGWLLPGRLTIFSTFPLGLFRAWSYVDFGTPCLVYPRPLPSALLACGIHAKQGGTLHTPRDGADDFSSLRDYRLGDAPRHVAWKASTKSTGLLTKQFITPGSATLCLDWHALGDADPELRLARLTALLLEAERTQQAYSLRLPNQEFPPGLGNAQRERCLKALALFGLEDANA